MSTEIDSLRCTQITSELERQQTCTAALVQLVGQLEEKLIAVLSPAIPVIEAEKTPDKPDLVPLANELFNANTCVVDMNSRLASITDRLQL